jgi:hypothetical protein
MNILDFDKKSQQTSEIDSNLRKILLHLVYKVKLIISSLLNKIGYPPIISNLELNDEIIGSKIKIEASNHWTKISIDNRDFYFSRITGKFAGTGCSTCR